MHACRATTSRIPSPSTTRTILKVRQRITVRSFFASSTDHSKLLGTAQVHRLDDDGKQLHQYVIAADGMDVDMVRKVPQLHLARLWRESNVLYGAKVVNSTLGSIHQVCGRLVEAALQDVKDGGGKEAFARSTLHGLSEWILKGLGGNTNNSNDDAALETILASIGDSDVLAVEELAKSGNLSKISEEIYSQAQPHWDKLAVEFIKQGLGEEAPLYEASGGVLKQIDHRADNTDYSSSSGGAMALYEFKL